MARFNAARINVSNAPDTVNQAYGEAHQESVELELVSLLLTSMVQDQFYRSADQAMARLDTLVDALVKDGEAYFAAQAAVYARRTFGLRSITHLLAAGLAKRVRGADWTKDFYNLIVRRPDDLTEILALVMKGQKSIPNAMKDGLARALTRFDEYGLAKYKGNEKSLKMVDAVNLLHPKATDALGKMVRGELSPADTWETGLSAAGQKAETTEQKAELKSVAWSDLVLNKKVGYLALVRNLRNILQQVTDRAVLQEVTQQLIVPEAITKSLIFPFQLHTAYDMVCEMTMPAENSDFQRMVLAALNKAAEISLSNVPVFDGRTLIAMDLSGSMTSGRVGTSTAAKVGGLFAAVLWKSNPGSDLMVFGSHATYAPFAWNDQSLFNVATALANADQGGTNFHNIFSTANKAYRRIIIISDMQAWEEYRTPAVAVKSYETNYSCKPDIYSLDLCGYGSLQFPEKKVYAMAGFSDKIFDVMKMLETDRMALVNKIKEINISTEAMKLTAQAKKGK